MESPVPWPEPSWWPARPDPRCGGRSRMSPRFALTALAAQLKPGAAPKSEASLAQEARSGAEGSRFTRCCDARQGGSLRAMGTIRLIHPKEFGVALRFLGGRRHDFPGG